MRTLLLFLLVSTSTAFAGEVSRQEASLMIDQMVKSNMISASEAEKAKARLQSMSGSDWAALNRDAEKKAADIEAGRAPASTGTSDLEAEQYIAIKNDLNKLAPDMVAPVSVDAIKVDPVSVDRTEVDSVSVGATVVENVTVPVTEVEHTAVEDVKVSEVTVPQT